MDSMDDLILRVRARADEPLAPAGSSAARYTPASAADLERAEHELGFTLHPLHRRLLLEVHNGGFGPGFGIIGIAGGHLSDGKTIVDLKREFGSYLPGHIIPLCDWGCAMWSCVDSASREGVVLTASNGELTMTNYSLRAWLEDWVNKVDIFNNLFEVLEQSGINPFTRQPMVYRSPGPAKGIPYRSVS